MLFSGIFCIALGSLNLVVATLTGNFLSYFAAGWCLGVGVTNFINYFVIDR